MILIALGANLSFGDESSPVTTCARALDAITGLGPGFVAVSPWYRSRPVPPDPAQPDFCNGVARFEGEADPEALLAALHRIEAAFGRVRSVANAARTLDLDLIDLNGMVRDATPPVLPHPRAHLRAFVLVPLLDVAPDWVHPVLNKSPGALLRALDDDERANLTRW